MTVHTGLRTATLAAAFSAVALVALPGAQGTTSQGAPPKVSAPSHDQKANPDAVALQDFKKRVDAYVALHKNAAKSTPPMKPTENPAEITAAMDALANRIRADRTTAKPGDIFTPEVRLAFRRILRPELKGADGKDAKEILKDDAPASVKLEVNSKYPETATRPTVPAAILTNLPPLPPEVEYRFIDRHLLLVDTKALVIADFMANALP